MIRRTKFLFKIYGDLEAVPQTSLERITLVVLAQSLDLSAMFRGQQKTILCAAGGQTMEPCKVKEGHGLILVHNEFQ